MSTRDRFDLVLLGVIWGASFLFTRITAPEFGAFALVEIRLAIGAAILTGLLAARGGFGELRGAWTPALIVGFFNSALPFALFAYALVFITAGTAAVINATTPLFGALVAYIWLNDRMTVMRAVGLAVGFCGVVLSAWDKISLSGGSTTLAIFATLGASLSYGVGVNYAKRRLTGVAPLAQATGSNIAAALLLLPLALTHWPSTSPTLKGWLCVAALGIFCTALAYVLYFRLITRVGPAKATTVTYLIPVFGMLWGYLFLHEGVTPQMLTACAVIVFGTALATGNLKLPWRSRDRVTSGA
ncbi:MAG TPA: DMT family transporter [Steroidobacteraceae bacterium]|nr:DMT family transporter [Steroidobacteraceae bacterium]